MKDPETDHLAIVMEYVSHKSLRTIKKNLTQEDIRYYMYQILKTLDYANSKGIFHRDLKVDNIAIDHANRKLKIIDWG